jgi:glucosyl-dolichyl phosphate glucuronosyltransferase
VVADVRDHGTSSVSVVICAYTTERWVRLRAAVDSVLQQSPAPEELLVVIDHNPELEEMAREEFEPDGVRVLANRGIPGLSGARNTGTARASGEVLVFLDDDAVAQPDWLAGHTRHYDDPDVIGVGGLVTASWECGAPSWFPPEFGWVVGCSYVGQPTQEAEIRNPIGANMSFRRSVLVDVGGFSDSLGRVGATPSGCEETELSIRAAAARPGRKIVYEPEAVVLHHVPVSRTNWAYFRSRCWREGVSKADVTRLSDPRRALAAERSYSAKVLPAGLRHNAGDALRRLEVAPLMRAATICIGFILTTAGYAAGRARLGYRYMRPPWMRPAESLTRGGAAG